MSRDSERVYAALGKYHLLLLNDASLPSVCGLVAGDRVRGSWWAHPRARQIFRVYDALEDDPAVLITKLVSRKVTYVHRSLWPQLAAIGLAREPWQVKRLSAAARKLWAAVERAPVEPDREMAKAASELDERMLVFSAQFHSESGAHVRRLESWRDWSRRTGTRPEGVGASEARATLEEAVARLNEEFDGRGVLPWQSR